MLLAMWLTVPARAAAWSMLSPMPLRQALSISPAFSPVVSKATPILAETSANCAHSLSAKPAWLAAM